MTDSPISEEQAARALTDFLTTKDRYQGTSPIERVVQRQISKMLYEMAAELVSATPGIGVALRQRVNLAVTRALQDDAWLTSQVTQAVAKVLTERALETE